MKKLLRCVCCHWFCPSVSKENSSWIWRCLICLACDWFLFISVTQFGDALVLSEVNPRFREGGGRSTSRRGSSCQLCFQHLARVSQTKAFFLRPKRSRQHFRCKFKNVKLQDYFPRNSSTRLSDWNTWILQGNLLAHAARIRYMHWIHCQPVRFWEFLAYRVSLHIELHTCFWGDGGKMEWRIWVWAGNILHIFWADFPSPRVSLGFYLWGS